jgi:predicted  nucleic acid-binding Zn-ribbon protein
MKFLFEEKVKSSSKQSPHSSSLSKKLGKSVNDRIKNLQAQIEAQERETANLREELAQARQKIANQSAMQSPSKTFSSSLSTFRVFEESAQPKFDYKFEAQHEMSGPEYSLKVKS